MLYGIFALAKQYLISLPEVTTSLSQSLLLLVPTRGVGTQAGRGMSRINTTQRVSTEFPRNTWELVKALYLCGSLRFSSAFLRVKILFSFPRVAWERIQGRGTSRINTTHRVLTEFPRSTWELDKAFYLCGSLHFSSAFLRVKIFSSVFIRVHLWLIIALPLSAINPQSSSSRGLR